MTELKIELHAAPELLAALKALIDAVPSRPAEQALLPPPVSQTAPVPLPAAPVNPAPIVPAVPVIPADGAAVAPLAPEKTYRFEELQVAAVSLADAGKRNEVLALMGRFGVQALSQLDAAQYGAFATALRGLGAKL